MSSQAKKHRVLANRDDMRKPKQGITYYEGKRGGFYHLSKSGRKIYTKDKAMFEYMHGKQIKKEEVDRIFPRKRREHLKLLEKVNPDSENVKDVRNAVEEIKRSRHHPYIKGRKRIHDSLYKDMMEQELKTKLEKEKDYST